MPVVSHEEKRKLAELGAERDVAIRLAALYRGALIHAADGLDKAGLAVRLGAPLDRERLAASLEDYADAVRDLLAAGPDATAEVSVPPELKVH